MKGGKSDERQYWLWVTRPEYYLEDDGSERECLDPSCNVDTGGWWTCHKDTRKGDLIFLWRTTPKRDIGYLLQAESDAYSIADDDYALEKGWDYGCDYHPLYKFRQPVTIQDLHGEPYLQDWGAYKAQFRRRVYRIPFEYWTKLNQLAVTKNPDYQTFIKDVQRENLYQTIILEEQLEERLVENLGLLKRFGYDLELYSDSITGTTGRQFVCKGNGGRIDLLCYERKRKRYVVIELKNVCASQSTFGQICNYVGWVQDRIAGDTPVIGLVISRGFDVKFQSSLKVTNRIFHLDIKELGFE
ncbi:MAG: EVE domain-containing protein [Chloroflexi bacterium]|nr:EVE domain-containing protein [Chloroflexota bacterium]